MLIMVEDETRREIDTLAVGPVAPGLVSIALTLAKQLDSIEEAPTSAAVVARELRATMLELRKVAPGKAKGDALDDLASRRAKRRGA